jgi:hypothetical protein
MITMGSSLDWPFNDPPNVAVVTVRRIVDGGQPILLVCHDEEDGGWQFLSGEPFDVADGMLVSLRNIITRDPTLVELADLPLGWKASRKRVGEVWERNPPLRREARKP